MDKRHPRYFAAYYATDNHNLPKQPVSVFFYAVGLLFVCSYRAQLLYGSVLIPSVADVIVLKRADDYVVMVTYPQLTIY